MTTLAALLDDELQYNVSFRHNRVVQREDVPPAGKFETTGRQRLARAARHRRGGGHSPGGIHQRGRG